VIHIFGVLLTLRLSLAWHSLSFLEEAFSEGHIRQPAQTHIYAGGVVNGLILRSYAMWAFSADSSAGSVVTRNRSRRPVLFVPLSL
jgi:hypothetical protein